MCGRGHGSWSTGKERRDEGNVVIIIWNSARKGRGGRCVVDLSRRAWKMAWYIAQWIGGRLPQKHILVASGSC